MNELWISVGTVMFNLVPDFRNIGFVLSLKEMVSGYMQEYKKILDHLDLVKILIIHKMPTIIYHS